MRHLRNSGRVLDISRDAEFSDFCMSLDAEMKRLQSEGVGSHKRPAEVITGGGEYLIGKRVSWGHHSTESAVQHGLLQWPVLCTSQRE